MKEIEKTKKFELSDEDWQRVAGDIRSLRESIGKQGMTSKLVRKDGVYWITICGAEHNVNAAMLLLDGIFVAKAPQTEEQKKARDSLDEQMREWAKNSGVGAKADVTQRK